MQTEGFQQERRNATGVLKIMLPKKSGKHGHSGAAVSESRLAATLTGSVTVESLFNAQNFVHFLFQDLGLEGLNDVIIGSGL